MKTRKSPVFGLLSYFQNLKRSTVWAMLCLALCLLGLSLSATAQEFFIVTPFDAPGAGRGEDQGTIPYGIVAGGAIVGYYITANNVSHGFLRSPHGRITDIDEPNAGTSSNQGTRAYAMNPQGEITGTYWDSSGDDHGFVRDALGNFTSFDGPSLTISPCGSSAAEYTEGQAINPEGWIVGDYVDSCHGAYHGLLRDPSGNLYEFDALGACEASFKGTWGLDINPTGVLTGWYRDCSDLYHGYVRTAGPTGTITAINVPTSPPWYGTYTIGIDPAGAITGGYRDSNGALHGFLRAPGGGITPFNAPGAGTSDEQGTEPECINPSGAIVGFYYDRRDVGHGFLRSPRGGFSTFEAPGAGHGTGQGTFPYFNNPEGSITGPYIDEHNVWHGFVAVPFP
jgi:hypothetical protein